MAITYLNNISLDDNQIKNFLIDKKTTTQRNAMTAAAGHAIYNVTDNKFQFYNGSAWLNLADELNTEEVQDIVGGMLGGTETGGITVTYDDANNHIDFALSSIPNSSLANSAITINGSSVSLGGTRTLVTDDIAEDGSPTNLWYTNARARAAVSVTDSGGDGSLSYNSSSGVITYTGPSAAEVRAHISAGTGVTVSSGQISIGQAVATNSDVTFNDVTVSGTLNSDDITATTVTISGNLVVSGTTTTVNSNTVAIGDNIMVLNNDETGTPSQDAGLEVERGTSTNVKLIWDESADRWAFTHDGSTFYNIPVPTEYATLVAGEGIDVSAASGAVTVSAEDATASNKGIASFNSTDFSVSSGAVSLAKDPVITLTGDVTGAATMTNLGNVSITTTVTNNQSYATNIGDGSATSFEVEHGLGTKDVIVQLYDVSSNDTVFTDVIRNISSKTTPEDWITINFASAPSSNDIRVLVSKCA
tara:strand:- start:248 stop:1672 length:1425 start_codon:yes stop_codon:yes gene_type:complete